MDDGKAVKVGDFGISKVMDTAVGKDQMAMPDAEGRVGTKRWRMASYPHPLPALRHHTFTGFLHPCESEVRSWSTKLMPSIILGCHE